MNRTRSLGIAWLVACAGCIGADTQPPFEEVYDIIRTNLAGYQMPEPATRSVEDLLKVLGTRFELVPMRAGVEAPAPTTAVVKTNLFDGAIAYFRLTTVKSGLASELVAALEAVQGTNKLSGIVLDLRFTRGSDYAAAAAVADLFATGEDVLLDWGSGAARATRKTNAISLPVVALVNRDTAGAAEALAALIRHIGAGLIIGTNTAGRAFTFDEFELSSGHRLRIAKSYVRLGTGEPLPEAGLEPDILVSVQPDEEREFLADPYRPVPAANTDADKNGLSSRNGGTNQATRVPRRRINEAELLREHREGSRLGPQRAAPAAEEPGPRVVTDPALARALDLIKGLAVLKMAGQE
ncbi:MAG: S41 family peptidase [Verrucomicrobiae bacterium]|nr:S41 family peptidase [Verrucomicrobiae bacterium]